MGFRVVMVLGLLGAVLAGAAPAMAQDSGCEGAAGWV